MYNFLIIANFVLLFNGAGLSDLNQKISTSAFSLRLVTSFVAPLTTGVSDWELDCMHRAGVANRVRKAVRSQKALRSLIQNFEQVKKQGGSAFFFLHFFCTSERPHTVR